MCRVEERVYISAEGHRSKFEEAFPCDKARNGRLCAKVKKRTTEYYPKKGAIPRNDTPSPISPPTPVGAGSYLVQQRRPSSSGRPSTRDGPKAIKPEIIIEFGSKKDKKYPAVSVSKAYKRQSLGASSVDDIDSPGSDASHTVRTGFPEAPLPPQAGVYGHADGYTPTTAIPHGYQRHHRNTSSTSSHTGSSRTPSLYVTSDPDYDSPTTTRNTRLPPAIHNPPATSGPPPPSPSKHRAHGGGASSTSYHTTVVTPQAFTQETHTPDGLFPLDYPDFADRSASSHTSSGVSSKSRRGKDHDQSRMKKEEERKRQEQMDREVAESLAKEENIKQVRFELGRAEGRAKERAETLLAEKDKQRAAEREEARRRKDQERVEELAAKERKKEKSKPPTTSNISTKRPAGSRRTSISMTPAQQDEQRRLLAADLGYMQGESRAAEAREREERNALLRQQQQDPSYYNPRTGATNASTLTRRDSHSRRASVSAEARPTLGRSNSNRRASIIQPNPPPVINTQVAQTYARQPSARTHAPPPVSFPTKFNTRPPSARRPSFSSQENPFAAPPTRGSNSSVDNPFAAAPSMMSPTATVHQDEWDARNSQESTTTAALSSSTPALRHSPDGHYSTQRRGAGDDVIHASGTHSAARQATRAMGRIAGFENAYETDEEDDLIRRHGRRRH